MTIQRTLSIIKPDATKRNITGKIITFFEEAGLNIIAQKKVQLTQSQAQEFYAVHSDKPFFQDLVNFMTSGPIIIQVLEGDEAISRNREIMGATNPEEAKEGTIRKEFALSIEANSVHGSDSENTAKEEISFFFNDSELISVH
jgi:nucleoside-diphosphate kinase